MEYGLDFRKGDMLKWTSRTQSTSMTQGKVYEVLKDAYQERWPYSHGGYFYCSPRVTVLNDNNVVVDRNTSHFTRMESGNV